MNTVTTLPLGEFNPREVAAPGDMGRVCRRFLQRIALRGYSPHTVSAYRTDLEQFAGFLAGRDVTSLHAVTRAAVEDFADALLTGEQMSPRTVHRKVQAVGSMFRFAVDNDIMRPGDNPLRNPLELAWHRAPVEAPSEAAILSLIQAIPTDTFIGRRDRAMFLVMYDAALRVSGVCALDCEAPGRAAVHGVRSSGVVSYPAKGGATGTAVIEPRTVAAVEDWLAVRHRFERADSPPALFLSQRGTRLTRASVHQRLKGWGREVGLGDIHCHLLRHRRAREIFRHAGPQATQGQLGHKHLSTTMNTYAGDAGEHVRNRIRTDAPIGGRGKC